jgi:hypothetical protein
MFYITLPDYVCDNGTGDKSSLLNFLTTNHGALWPSRHEISRV